eukprot:CAMPEP_0204825748 /NCGR_PEP_ID=MMETSP1346-20131115/3560_1 /ASSEMBLY_ACC=CAM_ASM_000771 /TAXON_ID=215587 /ORGANISM="Aplanochytrium stocchinoi, Strain GSBS06" /LENGTH=137 /DNA_ID=CAMNT_0051953471 /DNA_START=258 /DNA_END=671 /DNA_ORIENTATION=+
MVVVEGLDRTGRNPYLQGMSDMLWSEHTKELQDKFKEAQSQDSSLTFKDFCRKYADGTAYTQAMEKNANSKTPKTLWPATLGLPGTEAVNVIKQERDDLSSVDIIPEGSMCTMDYREDRVRVFVDESGKVLRIPQIG